MKYLCSLSYVIIKIVSISLSFVVTHNEMCIILSRNLNQMNHSFSSYLCFILLNAYTNSFNINLNLTFK